MWNEKFNIMIIRSFTLKHMEKSAYCIYLLIVFLQMKSNYSQNLENHWLFHNNRVLKKYIFLSASHDKFLDLVGEPHQDYVELVPGEQDIIAFC